jgi:hypothetical protein
MACIQRADCVKSAGLGARVSGKDWSVEDGEPGMLAFRGVDFMTSYGLARMRDEPLLSFCPPTVPGDASPGFFRAELPVLW